MYFVSVLQVNLVVVAVAVAVVVVVVIAVVLPAAVCCATNRKVTGSIPAGVIGIFH